MFKRRQGSEHGKIGRRKLKFTPAELKNREKRGTEMNLFDRYVNWTGKHILLNKRAKIDTEDMAIIRLLKECDTEGGINKVIFIKDIPPEIKEEIQQTFGIAYRENDEGYVIKAGEEIRVYSLSEEGLFLGANGLAHHLRRKTLRKGLIYNYPVHAVRGVKVYIPARSDIAYFKEFADYCAFYGINTMMIEIGGAMEYKKHPEINEGWIEYCQKFTDYQGQCLDIQNAPNWARNSIHMENGGGSFLKQTEMKELLEYLRERHFKVIPELPTLTHCDYLLTRHPELRERKEDELPDTYCPSNRQSYELVFELLDEIIDVFEPEVINIGHDELLTVGKCEQCSKKAPEDLYAEDIIKIYRYLKERHIRTMIWSEMLLNDIMKDGETGGGSHRFLKNQKTGLFMEERPAIYPAIDKLPEDIVMLHWYWGRNRRHEEELLKRHYKVIFGNFSGTEFYDFPGRKEHAEGTMISNWSVLNRDHLQRNGVLFNIAYTAAMTWGRMTEEMKFEEAVEKVSEDIYQYQKLKSGNGIEVVHHTKVFKEHFPFVDGFMIDKEDDYLGSYDILMESGKKFSVPLYYNLNIGTCRASMDREEILEEGTYRMKAGQFMEATCQCGIECREGTIYYRYFIEIPEGEKVLSIEKREDSKYGENIVLKGVYL